MNETCDRCDRPAEVHEIDPIHGTAVHLCRDHAIEAGFDVPAQAVLSGAPIPAETAPFPRQGPAENPPGDAIGGNPLLGSGICERICKGMVTI